MGSNPDVRRQPAHSAAVKAAFPGLQQLVDAGDEVRALLAHPGWAHIDRLVGLEVADLDAALDGRLLESKADYAFRHGQRRGLRAPADLAHAIVSLADQRLEEQRIRHEGAAEAALREAA